MPGKHTLNNTDFDAVFAEFVNTHEMSDEENANVYTIAEAEFDDNRSAFHAYRDIEDLFEHNLSKYLRDMS